MTTKVKVIIVTALYIVALGWANEVGITRVENHMCTTQGNYCPQGE